MISRAQPYGPIDEQGLVRFEQRLSAALPADLRRFLLEHNGATFSDAGELVEVPGGTALGEIFGLHGGPEYLRLDCMAAQFETLVPPTILVFASDLYGNYFGISLASGDTGAVYFIDHENLPAARDSLIRVASSFTELLSRTGTDVARRVRAATVVEAIDSGDDKTLKELLDAGADLTGSVHRAVHHANSRILATILERGGDPNERGAIGGTETPLFVAARQGRADLTELLLHHEADPNLCCGAGGTALQMAKPWPRVVEVLLRSGARG